MKLGYTGLGKFKIVIYGGSKILQNVFKSFLIMLRIQIVLFMPKKGL